MRFFDRAQIHPIGLDIGRDGVRMIQLERQGERLSVVAAARGTLAIPDGNPVAGAWLAAAAADVVRQLLRWHPFRGRRVVAMLPGELVCVRTLRLPPVPAAHLASAVRAEAAAVLPFNPAEARMQFLAVGDVHHAGQTHREVIVLAARSADIEQFMSGLSQSGLELDELDAEPCALYRTVERFVRRKDDLLDVHALLEVGHGRSQVVIGKGREIHFIKPIEIGGRHFEHAVSRKLGVTRDEARALRRRLTGPADGAPAAAARDPVREAANGATRAVMEELAGRVALCLRYHAVTFRGQRPAKVRVVGSGAADQDLLAILNRALPLPAELGRPLHSVDTSRMHALENGGSSAAWAAAFGSALKCVERTFGPRDGKTREPQTTGVEGEADRPVSEPSTNAVATISAAPLKSVTADQA
jgi:type IV pilus assembly protein PilM